MRAQQIQMLHHANPRRHEEQRKIAQQPIGCPTNLGIAYKIRITAPSALGYTQPNKQENQTKHRPGNRQSGATRDNFAQ